MMKFIAICYVLPHLEMYSDYLSLSITQLKVFRPVNSEAHGEAKGLQTTLQSLRGGTSEYIRKYW